MKRIWIVVLSLAIGAHAQQPAPPKKPDAPVFAPPATQVPADQPLVPAALGLRTDKLGNSWNFQANGKLGRIGLSMMNGGAELRVNNNEFLCPQPMMTQDGKEFVFPGTHSGLTITRRVRLDEKSGVVRYLEIFHNPSANDVKADVELRTNISGTYKAYVTEQGNPGAAVLEKSETGLLLTPSSPSQRTAYLLTLRSPGSPLKPAISSQNRYLLSAHYQITAPAGETVCLLHTMAQVAEPKALDRKTLAGVFEPGRLQKFVSGIPREFRGRLANFSLGQEAQGLALLAATSLESLDVKRGRKDILAVGAATRLVGSSTCGKLSVTTDYGVSEIPFEDVDAVVGGNRGLRERGKVFLRGGQVYGGAIQADALKFVLHNGNVMDLDVSNLDRLVRAQQPADKDSPWPAGVAAFLETHSGDRLALTATDAKLSLISPWGALTLSLADILSISSPDSEPVGYWVQLRNGSQFYAYLSGEPFQFTADRFGAKSIPSSQIRALVSRQAFEAADDPKSSSSAGNVDWQNPRLTQPYLTLRGQQRLVGRVLDPALHILPEGEALNLAPENIRFLVNLSEDLESTEAVTPTVRAELWGGGVVAGELRERVLTVDVLGTPWRVPVGDISQVVVPTPRVSDASRAEIAKWIRQLGDDNWQARERASQELVEFGYLAKPQLLEAFTATEDPEVSRRVELLLAPLE